MQTRNKLSARVGALLMFAILSIGAAACGGDDSKESASSGNPMTVERSFLTGMAHHHETAIEMAKIAQERGKSSFVKNLAGEIVSTQERELGQMKDIHKRLIGGELKPDATAHDGLGLSAEEAGMTHTPETNRMLEMADPFDRAFVDEMVPHHRGAVAMAKVVLETTKDPDLRNLAQGIVTTQEQEVKEMNAFREREFGEPVPETMGAAEGGAEHGAGH